MSKVVILGAGVMGSALAVPLADNGHEVRVVGTHLDVDIVDALQNGDPHPRLGRHLPESVSAHQLADLESAAADCDIVLSGVNSVGVEWAGDHLARILRPGQRVVAIAKGARGEDDGTVRLLPDVLASRVDAELRDSVGWAAIVGPSIAGEVAARRDSCVVFCGRDQTVLDDLAGHFRTSWYHVWTSTDLTGCEICAATKNCYALAVGFAAGRLEAAGETASPDRAHDYEAALFAQAASEMRRWVELLEGSPETPYWLPGVGDMYVTSTGGRNVRVGQFIGQGLTFGEASQALGNPTLEGASAIRVLGGAVEALTARAIVGAEEFPLMRHLYSVVVGGRPLDMPWSDFFGGEPARR